jgi:hypothetical protein
MLRVKTYLNINTIWITWITFLWCCFFSWCFYSRHSLPAVQIHCLLCSDVTDVSKTTPGRVLANSPATWDLSRVCDCGIQGPLWLVACVEGRHDSYQEWSWLDSRTAMTHDSCQELSLAHDLTQGPLWLASRTCCSI